MTARNVLHLIDGGERKLMSRIQRWPAPRWIRVWAIYATRGGDGWLWYSLAVVILLFGGSNRFVAIGSCGLASATGSALFLALKKKIRRKRPNDIQPHCWAKLMPPDQFSFPSGHTINAFAISLPLILYYPAMAPGLLFCAFSIAVSRVLLGMHYFTDVVAGGILGALVGTGAFRLLTLVGATN